MEIKDDPLQANVSMCYNIKWQKSVSVPSIFPGSSLEKLLISDLDISVSPGAAPFIVWCLPCQYPPPPTFPGEDRYQEFTWYTPQWLGSFIARVINFEFTSQTYQLITKASCNVLFGPNVTLLNKSLKSMFCLMFHNVLKLWMLVSRWAKCLQNDPISKVPFHQSHSPIPSTARKQQGASGIPAPHTKILEMVCRETKGLFSIVIFTSVASRYVGLPQTSWMQILYQMYSFERLKKHSFGILRHNTLATANVSHLSCLGPSSQSHQLHFQGLCLASSLTTENTDMCQGNQVDYCCRERQTRDQKLTSKSRRSLLFNQQTVRCSQFLHFLSLRF